MTADVALAGCCVGKSHSRATWRAEHFPFSSAGQARITITMPSLLIRLALGILVYAVPWCLAVAAEADEKPNEKAAITEVGDNFVTAVIAKDAKALREILADDFFTTEADGTTSDKQQYIERLTSKNLSVTKIETEDVRIRIYDGTAVETGRVLNEGTDEGRKFTSRARYMVFYVRNDDRWQPTVQQVTLIRDPQ